MLCTNIRARLFTIIIESALVIRSQYMSIYNSCSFFILIVKSLVVMCTKVSVAIVVNNWLQTGFQLAMLLAV